MNHREVVGKCITDLRQKKGYTQEQLAELTGLTQGNIARIEQGKYSTGIDLLGKIADALNCRIILEESFSEEDYKAYKEA